MNLEKFTERAQAAISTSQDVAIKKGHQQLDGEHLHYALVTQEDGLIPKLISYMGQDVEWYVADLEKELSRIPSVHGSSVSNLYLTRRFSQILLNAQDEAKRFKDDYTSVEHIYISTFKGKGYPSHRKFLKTTA